MPSEPDGPARILVIKLSALGDIIQALGAMQAIRRHHRGAHITLLTTAPYAELARRSGCFDEVWLDPRPKPWQLAGWLGLVRRLRAGRFDRVYDLQRQERTAAYYHLLGRPKPEWIGIVRGCSHRFVDPGEPVPMTEIYAGMVALGGIGDVGPPDLSFLDADIDGFGIRAPFALLVPGSAAHRTVKRWPAERYAALAGDLAGRGITPVLIGGPSETEELGLIAAACPACRNPGLAAGLAEIATLARGARVAVGNDTGPTHIAAAAGCPTLALFGGASDPIVQRPPGPAVDVLYEDSLASLPLERVRGAMRALERAAPGDGAEAPAATQTGSR